MSIILMDEIKDRVASKTKWFEAGAMRFFRTRLPATAWERDGAAYFVSSEQFVGPNGYTAPRLYSIRKVDLTTGQVDTVGEFQQYKTRAQANGALQRLLNPPVQASIVTFDVWGNADDGWQVNDAWAAVNVTIKAIPPTNAAMARFLNEHGFSGNAADVYRLDWTDENTCFVERASDGYPVCEVRFETAKESDV